MITCVDDNQFQKERTLFQFCSSGRIPLRGLLRKTLQKCCDELFHRQARLHLHAIAGNLALFASSMSDRRFTNWFGFRGQYHATVCLVRNIQRFPATLSLVAFCDWDSRLLICRKRPRNELRCTIMHTTMQLYNPNVHARYREECVLSMLCNQRRKDSGTLLAFPVAIRNKLSYHTPRMLTSSCPSIFLYPCHLCNRRRYVICLCTISTQACDNIVLHRFRVYACDLLLHGNITSRFVSSIEVSRAKPIVVFRSGVIPMPPCCQSPKLDQMGSSFGLLTHDVLVKSW